MFFKDFEFILQSEYFTIRMSFKCSFCSRTFSTKSGYSQHVNVCQPLSSDEEPSLIITDINNMSLDSEELTSDLAELVYMDESCNENEVRNLFYLLKKCFNVIFIYIIN